MQANVVDNASDTTTTSAIIITVTATRTYDARNRIDTLTFPDNGNQSWTYQPDSLPDTVTTYNDAGASSVTNTYAYNHRRLLIGESQQADSNNWSVGYGFDANASLSTVVYPDSLGTVSYAPNALGQPTQAGTYATGVQYYPNGAIQQFTYGNGIVHSLTQNMRGLPDRSQDVDGSTSIHDDSYDYDTVGNVLAISDAVTGNRGDRDMDYDDLNRLTSATSPMFGTASYTYNALDNLTHVQVTGGSQIRDQDYVYDAHNRLTNLMEGGASVVGLGYDVQGNLNNKSGVAYTFDYGNRMRAGGPETYRYDVQGRRFRSSSSAGLVYSVYAQSGQLLFQRDERSSKRRQYVYLGGSLVAESDVPLAGGTATVTYQHTDALGSPVATTSSAKAVLQRSEYEPYGYLLNRPMQDGPGYTGHVTDAATGLVYMQQRYCDPQIGRCLSVDPVTAYDNGDMRFFNRYAYVFNNPYKFNDPDGRWPDWLKTLIGRPVDSVGPRREMSEKVASVVNQETRGIQDAARSIESTRQAVGQQVKDRVSVNASYAASAGTGTQGTKNLAGKGNDSVGWIPVGEGAYAGVTADVKVLSLDFSGGKTSPISYEASADVGALGSLGGSINIDPAGKIEVTISIGLGIGEHTSFSPKLNVEL
jgi:RHS repeat-associated protein